jgi:hypothetical protein
MGNLQRPLLTPSSQHILPCNKTQVCKQVNMARYFVLFSIIHTYIFIRKGTFARAKTRPVNQKTLDFFFAGDGIMDHSCS